MATLYQLHSAMDTLSRNTEEMAITWQAGDSILLLGATVAFIEWLTAYLEENDIQGIMGLYALVDDVAQLAPNTTAQLNLNTKLTGLLTDQEWVEMTQNNNAGEAQFDKVITIV